MDTQIAQLADLLRQSQRAVVFSGMGISTESGPPKFRKPFKIIEFSDFIGSEDIRREFWRNQFSGGGLDWSHLEPNKGHMAVAKLVKLGKVSSVITQCVDNFHRRSGVPDDRLIEYHGNSTYAACIDCWKRYELTEVRAIFEPNETLPVCSDCGGIINIAWILFGQPIPEEVKRLAEQEALACDSFLVLGSSLQVQPAATIPKVAKQNGAILIIINNEATDFDELCDLVIHRPIGLTLPNAVERI
ncbi:MAG: Sir2 family NAD-dependent protein deacetylase [Deltaproteobacteria bacterium]|jgi:NAD-dependent protein deacetylase/lipoamidase|nr:Sir2 family NAD-dependent protein deacetylase [Deltaproteobacteria bacterium]